MTWTTPGCIVDAKVRSDSTPGGIADVKVGSDPSSISDVLRVPAR